MNFKKTGIAASLTLALGAISITAQAANLNNGDVLTIISGIPTYVTTPVYDDAGNQTGTTTTLSNVTKSWFGMDNDGSGAIAGSEKTVLEQGTTGIVIGTATTAGPSHSGAPASGETGAIDKAWNFFGNTGSDFAATAITGGTAGLDMSGWRVTWNAIASINMGAQAWGTGFTDGVGNFTWNGVDGAGYTLNYRATVPLGDISGFGGVKYALHLEGVVKTVAYVAGTSPANSGSLVLGASPSVADFVVTFSKAVTGVTASNIAVSPSVTKGTPTIDGACATAGQCNIWHFPVTLTAPNTYTVTFSATGVTDVANGYALQTSSPSPASVGFTTTTTADVTQPTVVTGSGNQFPLPSATGVATTPTVTVTFNDNSGGVTVAAGGIKLVLTSDNTQVLCSNFLPNASSTVYTCTPTTALLPTTSYTVLINPALVTDGAGNQVTAANNSWAFTTTNVPSMATQGATVAVSGSPNVTSLSVSTTPPGTELTGIAFGEYVSYTINNVTGSATVTVTFPYAIAGMTLYKVEGSTYTDLSTMTLGANGCLMTSRNDSTNTITLTINDNGGCDNDAVVGTITDPLVGGAAPVSGGGIPASGPAGGGCAMNPAGQFDGGMLFALLGGLGYASWRRRHT